VKRSKWFLEPDEVVSELIVYCPICGENIHKRGCELVRYEQRDGKKCAVVYCRRKGTGFAPREPGNEGR
jgi:hypothetical protein